MDPGSFLRESDIMWNYCGGGIVGGGYFFVEREEWIWESLWKNEWVVKNEKNF